MQLDPVALRVIAAVARHGTLTRAAAVLGLSQPALSYQLRRAEDHLGTALFTRSQAGCRPTAAGEILLRALLPALAQIDAALAEVAAQVRAPSLRVLTDFGFAGLWLMPRLSRFRGAHPGLEIQIIAAQTPQAPGPGDMSIRFADAADVLPGAQLLMPERVVPVCAPGLAVDDLAQAALLHLDAPATARWMDWEGWLAGQGISRARRPGEFAVNSYDFVIQAALAGQGVALGWRPLIDPHLASGALRPAGPEITRPQTGYWIEAPGPETAPRRLLADWLLAETG